MVSTAIISRSSNRPRLALQTSGDLARGIGLITTFQDLNSQAFGAEHTGAYLFAFALCISTKTEKAEKESFSVLVPFCVPYSLVLICKRRIAKKGHKKRRHPSKVLTLEYVNVNVNVNVNVTLLQYLVFSKRPSIPRYVYAYAYAYAMLRSALSWTPC